MARFTQGSSETTRGMATAKLWELMAAFTRVVGRMVSSMERVCSPLKARAAKVSGSTANDKNGSTDYKKIEQRHMTS